MRIDPTINADTAFNGSNGAIVAGAAAFLLLLVITGGFGLI